MARSNNIESGPSRKPGLHTLRARSAVRGSAPLVRIEPRRLQQVYIVANQPQSQLGAAPVILPEDIVTEAKSLKALGVERVKVFVRNEIRDAKASEASNAQSFAIEVIKRWKDAAPEICLATETCLCPFTSTGLCGILTDSRHAIAEATYTRLVDLALAQAEVGADILGIANMIGGSVTHVKEALTTNGWHDVAIVPHLIVESSWVYGPFRQATGVDANVDRSATQIHPENGGQVISQLHRFHHEGADRVLLEPAFNVVDHLVRMADADVCPVDAFVVSGEYNMAMTGSSGLAQHASLTALLFRAGADTVATYAAKDLAKEFAV